MTAVHQQLNLSDVRFLSRKFLREFIALYKTLPSLWNVKSKLYYDRSQKNADYNILVRKLKEVEPDANRAMVTQKINSMRSARRKEVSKIKQSIDAGGEIHEPKLWYFKLMDFLDGQEVERKRRVVKTENGDDEDSSPESPEGIGQIDPESAEVKPPDRLSTSSANSSHSDSEAPTNPVVAFTSHVPRHAKKRKANESRQTYEAFGNYVARKMQVLPFKQRVYLEKIINDSMFEAELGNLNRNCYVYVPPADSETIP